MVLQNGVEKVENPFRQKEAEEKEVSQQVSSPVQSYTLKAEGDRPEDGQDPFPLPSLSLRELTGFEEEFIEAHATELNTAKLVNEVLSRCLVEPGKEPGTARETVRNLLVADRDVALIQLRQISIGDHISTETNCPSCGTGNEVEFRLSSLPIEFKRPPQRLKVELPDECVAILRLPTAGDQEALFDANLDGDAQYRSWLLARLLLEIGGDEGPFDLTFARSLSTAVRTVLETQLSAVIPALDLAMGVTCHACSKDFTIPFDVSSFFFLN